MKNKKNLTIIFVFAIVIASMFLKESSIYAKSNDGSLIMPNRIGLVEKKEFVETKSITKSVKLGGQDVPISFSSPGGVFITRGGINVSLSIGYAYKDVSFSVSVGYVSKDAVSGEFLIFPADGKPYVVMDKLDIDLDIYRVELYDQEQGKVLKTYYKGEPTIKGHNYYLERR